MMAKSWYRCYEVIDPAPYQTGLIITLTEGQLFSESSTSWCQHHHGLGRTTPTNGAEQRCCGLEDMIGAKCIMRVVNLCESWNNDKFPFWR